MKSEKYILERINEIKKDTRLYQEPATLLINAPLALIQLTLEVELNTLEQVLELPLSRFPLQKEKEQSNEKVTF